MNVNEKKISIDLGNKLLANTAVLMMQTFNYHWNVVGSDFDGVHTILDTHYNVLFLDLDVIAERVRTVGGVALGSMKEMIQVATLKEDAGSPPESEEMLRRILNQYELQVEELREAISVLDQFNDFGSIKIYSDLLEKYEKSNWMLRSTL